MAEHTPRLSDSPFYLQQPFRLTGEGTAKQFTGCRTADGVSVLLNGYPLFPLNAPDNDHSPCPNLTFDWGPIDWDDPANEIRIFNYYELARTLLTYTLTASKYPIEELFHIDKSFLKKLPRWHRTELAFIVQFYQYPLAKALTRLPRENFVITDRDIQTLICEFMLDEANWLEHSSWSKLGQFIEADCISEGKIPPTFRQIAAHIAPYAILALIGLFLLAIIIRLLYRPVGELIKGIYNTFV